MAQQVQLGCGGMMMGGTPTEYCAALARLIKEHGPLREMMDEFHELALQIGKEADEDSKEPLKTLHEKVNAFIRDLDPHSRREEDVLFKMMEKYIGRQGGPILVMEYEHEQAKQNLAYFNKKMEQVSGQDPITAQEAKAVAQFAIQAHAILTMHFLKEESVLFPMAQQMLNEEEKQILEGKFNQI